jgi:N-acetylglucosamine-6-phosphate deacetylase
MEDCAVLVDDGQIADVFNEGRYRRKSFPRGTATYDVQGAFISPGFIDTHIHGFAGAGTEDRSAEAIISMADKLAAYGVTAFCPTVYPQDEKDMISSIRACVEAGAETRGAKIMGIHLEGPFISPTRLGALKAEFVRSVNMDFMERLFNASEGRVTNMTVAPEIRGMRELALYCMKKGIVLQAGHTDASYGQMVEGMQAGILHSTHFFNAMSGLHHRDPGAVGAIMIHPEISCEIIADGKHVDPNIILLLLRDKPFNRVVLVTDALKSTGQRGGPLISNHEEVVYTDGLFRRKKDDVIAGSALTMIAGIKNLSEFGIPLENAVEMASSNPSRIFGFRRQGLLVPGYLADITVFSRDFEVLATMINGRFAFNEL